MRGWDKMGVSIDSGEKRTTGHSSRKRLEQQAEETEKKYS